MTFYSTNNATRQRFPSASQSLRFLTCKNIVLQLAAPTFDGTGMIFGLQAPREYTQGPQVEWLDMQVGNVFERPT